MFFWDAVTIAARALAAGMFGLAGARPPDGERLVPESLRVDAEREGHRLTVVESDTLSKDEVGAVFAYLQRRLHYPLHCIVDTAGKSLHGWFDAPRNKLLETHLKVGLEVFG